MRLHIVYDSPVAQYFPFDLDVMAPVLLEETPACHCVIFAEIEHGAALIAFEVVVAILIFDEWIG